MESTLPYYKKQIYRLSRSTFYAYIPYMCFAIGVHIIYDLVDFHVIDVMFCSRNLRGDVNSSQMHQAICRWVSSVS